LIPEPYHALHLSASLRHSKQSLIHRQRPVHGTRLSGGYVFDPTFVLFKISAVSVPRPHRPFQAVLIGAYRSVLPPTSFLTFVLSFPHVSKNKFRQCRSRCTAQSRHSCSVHRATYIPFPLSPFLASDCLMFIPHI
jgi:hypothetical protein